MASTTKEMGIFLTLLAILLHGALVSGASRRSPFLSRPEAHQMLGRPDIGRYKALTATLGLRADISDGWEELLRDSPQKSDPVSLQIDVILQKNWLSKQELRHLAEKSVFRSPVAMGFLNTHHGLASQIRHLQPLS